MCVRVVWNVVLFVRDFFATLQEQRTPFICLFFSSTYTQNVSRSSLSRVREVDIWIMETRRLRNVLRKKPINLSYFFSYIRAKPILFHFFLYIRPRTQKCIKNYYIVRARKNDERKGETFPVWFSTSDA